MNEQASMAAQLAALGYMIFPCWPDTKIPATRWRLGDPGERPSCNAAKITAHWRDNPLDNIGVDCEESGLLVFDLDSNEAAAAVGCTLGSSRRPRVG